MGHLHQFGKRPGPRRKLEQVSTVDVCMGTVVQQTVWGGNARQAAAAVQREIRRLQSLLSVYSSGSDVAGLNKMAGKGPVTLHPDTVRVLSRALEISSLSDGAFDITAGPLIKAWAVTSGNPVPPSGSAISSLRDLVSYRDLHVDGPGRSAYLAKPGQMVDLGGIGKGFAGDKAASVYRRHGIESALLDLGGNIVAVGSRPDGSPWNVGIQDPAGARGECLGVLQVRNRSVVTSGDYERYFEAGGRRYHHIIDPATGYPASSGLSSVTVVGDDSMTADGLSTAVFVLGAEKGLRLIAQVRGAEAVLVTSAREVIVTDGLKQAFSLVACRTGYAMTDTAKMTDVVDMVEQ
jgi:thiamine biosynthesis lipoprotein